MPLFQNHENASITTRLKNFFISGILVSTPILLTIYLVWWLVKAMDNIVRPLVPDEIATQYGYFPGYGLVVTLLAVTLFGAFVRGFLGRYIVRVGESIVDRMPVIRGLYTTIKQISQALFDKESSSFREVGLIEYPRKGIWAVCFITGTAVGEIQTQTKEEVVNVFIPTTPNPTSGFLLFVPRKDIHILKMSVDDGIKLVISAGVIAPAKKKGKTLKSPSP